MQYFLNPIQNHFADFNGRESRKNFWMYVLYYVLIGAAITVVERVIGMTRGGGPGLLYGIFSLATILPSIAISVRRLHDTGKTGWLVLLWLIPVIGAISVLVLCSLEGEEGDNQYGIDPEEVDIL